MSAMVSPRSKAVTLMRPRCSGVTSIVRRAVKRSASEARDAAFSALAPKPRRRSDGRRSFACGRRSSCKPPDFCGKRDDLASGQAVAIDLANQSAAAGRVGETDALPD